MKSLYIPNNKIRRLNLKPITLKLLKQRKHHRWSKANILQIEEMYRMFLFLCLKYPRNKIVPNHEVDLFWHEHILYTKKYNRDCKTIFGKYLHHNPSVDIKSKKQLKLLYQQTLTLIKKEFYP